jgi:hypothetical protein
VTKVVLGQTISEDTMRQDKPTLTNVKPSRTVVGSDYYFAAGVVRSGTQYQRMKKDGRISKPFKLGSRDAQDKDVADADIARLTGQSEDAA